MSVAWTVERYIKLAKGEDEKKEAGKKKAHAAKAKPAKKKKK